MRRTGIALGAICTLFIGVAILSPAQNAVQTPAVWTPIGLSGGGAMYTPAISPADHKRMMVNCDMSAAYVTGDGGLNWRMINELELHSSTRCRPAFDPTDPNTIYAADGGAGMKVTHDGGVHWRPIGNLPGDLRGDIAIDPGNPKSLLVGAGAGIFRSGDAGRTWVKCEGPSGEPISYHFDQTSPINNRTCFAATSAGIWRSTDTGTTLGDRKTMGLS